MSIPLDTLEAEVLKLSAGARSHLLDRLIASLETDSEIEQAWALEAERRDAEVEAGKVVAVPGAQFLDRLRSGLQ
ncbi:MAG: addiction module protein [Proteobacteria bacterium]|mgnify:FL=1|jgi:putative addiction module component (TIGR02574 family)|nr:addiction module protein [Pseudomonadota bacterium]